MNGAGAIAMGVSTHQAQGSGNRSSNGYQRSRSFSHPASGSLFSEQLLTIVNFDAGKSSLYHASQIMCMLSSVPKAIRLQTF